MSLESQQQVEILNKFLELSQLREQKLIIFYSFKVRKKVFIRELDIYSSRIAEVKEILVNLDSLRITWIGKSLIENSINQDVGLLMTALCNEYDYLLMTILYDKNEFIRPCLSKIILREIIKRYG
jgi:hypothetical protein